MTINTDDLLNSILESLSRLDYIHPEKLPDIPLYMDQVTTFIDEQLHASKRYADDKILTKPMINNYAKNDLLPPPEKKKYTKEHILTLIFIYYLKNVLSISDIQKVLNPITNKYFGKNTSPSLEEIYSAVFSLEAPANERMQENIKEEFQISREAVAALGDFNPSEKDFLEKFIFICLLNFDVYVKKLLMEKIIDSMKEPESPKGKKKK